MTLLDQQIDAAERALRAFEVLGRRVARRGKPATGAIDLVMGMELVLRNLRFQKKHEPAFRRLARQLIGAEQEAAQDAAIQNVLGAFPGSEITDINIDALERLEEI